MTQIGSVYGGALYALARDEEIADQINKMVANINELNQKNLDRNIQLDGL